MVQNNKLFGGYAGVIESLRDDAREEHELDSVDKLIPPGGVENPEVNGYEVFGFHD